MNREEREALKVGDRVGMVSYGRYGLSDRMFGRVTKVTKTGQIVVENEKVPGSTRRFDKNGYEMGHKYNGLSLLTATDLQERLDAIKRQHDANARAKELLDEIQKHKTGFGDYSFDEETRGKLLALVAQL